MKKESRKKKATVKNTRTPTTAAKSAQQPRRQHRSEQDAVSQSVKEAPRRQHAAVRQPMSKQHDDKPRKKLAQEEFYHGLITRNEAVSMLQRDGDFLLRASETPMGKQPKPEIDIILTVLVDKTPKHYTLEYQPETATTPRKVRLAGSKRQFDKAADLVDYFREHPLSKGVKLVRPVPRPSHLIDSRHVERLHSIGSGCFATVYLGRWKRSGKGHGEEVAIKVCNGTDNAIQLKEQKEEMLKEAKLMANYCHPNVVRFLGVAADVPPMMLVLEYCPGGSLLHYLREKKGDLPEKVRLQYLLQAASGMTYLAQQKCIHRDLAARNCLLGTKGEIKIADFGLANVFNANVAGQDDEENVGIKQFPIPWLAPECLQRRPSFSEKSDVYAFGVLIFEVFSDGQQPWARFDESDAAMKELAKMVRRGRTLDAPASTPAVIKQLMADCHKKQPTQRPTFATIVQRLTAICDPESSDTGLTTEIQTVDGTQESAIAKNAPHADHNQ